MIPSLRNRHRLIWIGLSLLLPLLFVAAVLVIPQTAYQDLLPQATAEAYPTVLRSHDTEAFLFNLRENAQGQKQLEVVLKEILVTPTATVSLSGNAGSEVVLGQLGSQGVYRFNWEDATPAPEAIQVKIRESAKGEHIFSAKL